MCNDLGDYYDRLGYNEHENIEQPPKESIDCPVDLPASTDKFQTIVVSDSVDSMLYYHSQYSH
jgi:hypothetical protein